MSEKGLNSEDGWIESSIGPLKIIPVNHPDAIRKLGEASLKDAIEWTEGMKKIRNILDGKGLQ